MKKVFEVSYEGHQIQVVNTWFHGERLYVDGELQDANLGLAARAQLTGILKSKDQTRKRIKVTIGGNFKINCMIFVDQDLIYPKNNSSSHI